MAVDPTDDDETDDDKELAAERKVRAARSLMKSQRNVETALDDFIARANEKILDVSGFDSVAREQQLQTEIAELKRKLAEAEADANSKVPKEPERVVEAKLKWAPVIGAFLLGCGAMFAINLAMRPSATPAQTAEPRPTPERAATTAPIAEPPPTTPTTPTNEVAQVQLTPAQVTPTPKQPKQPKQPKAATMQPATTPAETATTPATTPKQGSGSAELYNPF